MSLLFPATTHDDVPDDVIRHYIYIPIRPCARSLAPSSLTQINYRHISSCRRAVVPTAATVFLILFVAFKQKEREREREWACATCANIDFPQEATTQRCFCSDAPFARVTDLTITSTTLAAERLFGERREWYLFTRSRRLIIRTPAHH